MRKFFWLIHSWDSSSIVMLKLKIIKARIKRISLYARLGLLGSVTLYVIESSHLLSAKAVSRANVEWLQYFSTVICKCVIP